MKKSTLFTAIIAFAVASVLTSCSFLQKGEFSQRKYYNFPRTNHNTEQTANAKTTKKDAPAPVIAREKVKVSEPVASIAVKDKNAVTQKPVQKAKTENKTNSVPVITKNDANETPNISFKKSDIRKQALKNTSHSPLREDAGVMLLVAIICAIFIPPLGVFIKDNWRTSKWFWVTLVLCLLAAGFLGVGNAGFSTIFGGLWLVAVIIALLAVFDVI